jgi:hypothetical protein
MKPSQFAGLVAVLLAARPAAAQAPVEEQRPAEKRVPLVWMTAGLLAVQAGTAAAFRDNDDWREEGHQWSDGIREAPVWDDDPAIYNYVLHPWVGSETFLLARNRGGGFLASLGYSALMSAVWEYGAENALCQPSATDLLVTPGIGSLLGELRYHGRRRLTASPRFHRWAGLLDPVDVTVGGYPDGRLHLLLNLQLRF